MFSRVCSKSNILESILQEHASEHILVEVVWNVLTNIQISRCSRDIYRPFRICKNFGECSAHSIDFSSPSHSEVVISKELLEGNHNSPS